MATDPTGQLAADAPPPPKFYPILYRRLRILKWLALVGGVGMFAGGVYEYVKGRKLQTAGAQTVGKLFDHRTLDTGKGRTSYRVTLDYQPADQERPFRKEFVVTQAAYDQVVQDRQATVTYLPDQPETSVVGDKAPIDTEPLAIGGGLLLVSAGVWWYQRREWKKIHGYITGG